MYGLLVVVGLPNPEAWLALLCYALSCDSCPLSVRLAPSIPNHLSSITDKTPISLSIEGSDLCASHMHKQGLVRHLHRDVAVQVSSTRTKANPGHGLCAAARFHCLCPFRRVESKLAVSSTSFVTRSGTFEIIV